MTKQTEAMKQALEFLKHIDNRDNDSDFLYSYECEQLDEAITALREALVEQPAKQDIPDLIAGTLGVSRGTAYDLMREALAEQPAQQEPDYKNLFEQMCQQHDMAVDKLKKAQRKSLTDEQIDDEHDKLFPPTIIPGARARVREFARAIEAKLREKNA